ncbi:MAG: hypothetical protein Q8S19_00290, partial [Bacillota bacterium]|nr:hypothetical protein [Bacillota bacterium]
LPLQFIQWVILSLLFCISGVQQEGVPQYLRHSFLRLRGRTTRYEVRGTRYEVRGTRSYLVLRTSCFVFLRGTRYEVQSTRYEIRGTSTLRSQ